MRWFHVRTVLAPYSDEPRVLEWLEYDLPSTVTGCWEGSDHITTVTEVHEDL